MKKLLFLAIPLLAAVSCTETAVIDDTYRWPTSGVAEADTLMVAFERARADANADVAARDEITARFCSVADAHPDNRTLAMRKLYVETCRQYPADPQGAAARLEEGMERFDSASAPYDWHSLQSLMLPSEKNIFRKYMMASSNVEYFGKAGAELEMAKNLVLKGNALCELSDTLGALECFDRAGGIFARRDAKEALYATRLNSLPLLEPAEAGELLGQLLRDTTIRNYPKVYVPLCQTAYYITDSVEYLDRAIDISATYTPARSLLPVLLSMKAAVLAENDKAAEALGLADSIRSSETRHNPSTRYRQAIHSNLAEVYDAAGMKDSCIAQLVELNFWTDSLQREANYRQIYANEARLHIEAVRDLARLKHRTVVVWWAVSLAAVILIFICVYRYKAVKRRQQIKLLDERIDNQLRLNLAQETILDNNEKLVAQTEAIVKGLSVQSMSSSEAIAQLRKVISDYRREEESRKGLITVSREVASSFSQRLKSDFPDISESQLRLASMIAAGMDSHQLSSALNISSKSLYTSRYRLRTRLGLPKDASLEDFLRKYASTSPG